LANAKLMGVIGSVAHDLTSDQSLLGAFGAFGAGLLAWAALSASHSSTLAVGAAVKLPEWPFGGSTHSSASQTGSDVPLSLSEILGDGLSTAVAPNPDAPKGRVKVSCVSLSRRPPWTIHLPLSAPISQPNWPAPVGFHSPRCNSKDPGVLVELQSQSLPPATAELPMLL
jgi:hypothetical protein